MPTEHLPCREHVRAWSRSVLAVMQETVPAPAAFCLIENRDSGYPPSDGFLITDGALSSLSPAQCAALRSQTLDAGVFAADEPIVDEHPRGLIVSFSAGGVAISAGVARAHDAPLFAPDERNRLAATIPVASELLQAYMRCCEYERREVVMRALRFVTDAYCVVEPTTGRVLWLIDQQEHAPCARDLLGDEPQFLALVNRLHQAATDHERMSTTARIGRTTIAKTVALGPGSIFGDEPVVAVALVAEETGKERLSPRERQIAYLLVRGYSTVNAAAILSLSENTVRTYVRRLYRKFDITNRADLARRCSEIAPDCWLDADALPAPVADPLAEPSEDDSSPF